MVYLIYQNVSVRAWIPVLEPTNNERKKCKFLQDQRTNRIYTLDDIHTFQAYSSESENDEEPQCKKNLFQRGHRSRNFIA